MKISTSHYGTGDDTAQVAIWSRLAADRKHDYLDLLDINPLDAPEFLPTGRTVHGGHGDQAFQCQAVTRRESL